MESQYDKGLALRRRAMGADYVSKAFDNATEFTQPLQEAITRRAWGETTTVYVASHALEPGDEVAFAPTEIPSALAGDHVATAPLLDGAIARQHVAVGEVISVADVATQSGPAALIPGGWLGVPVVESPASGAEAGDRVLVASDGVVIAAEAVVAGHLDGVTLVAVPADVAPLLPMAADAGRLTLLLTP